MRRALRAAPWVLILVAAGCRSQPDPASLHPYYHHIYKCGLTYDRVIPDPRRWALEQFADGPIDGPEVDAYAKGVIKSGLKEARADLDGDGQDELFLRQDVPARVWGVLVFTPVPGGYRYIGDIGGGDFWILPRDEAGRPRILACEPLGGQATAYRTYRHDGRRFEWLKAEDIKCEYAPLGEADQQRLDLIIQSASARLDWKRAGR